MTHEIFIYRLAGCFTTAVILWALVAYTELWVNYNMRRTQKILSGLLGNVSTASAVETPDYLIAQGSYKGRRIVCRMNAFSPSRLLHYDLRLHIHIEPLTENASRLWRDAGMQRNLKFTHQGRITYECTSKTAIKSFLFSAMIDKEEFIQIFEELTRAAEAMETRGSVA